MSAAADSDLGGLNQSTRRISMNVVNEQETFTYLTFECEVNSAFEQVFLLLEGRYEAFKKNRPLLRHGLQIIKSTDPVFQYVDINAQTNTLKINLIPENEGNEIIVKVTDASGKLRPIYLQMEKDTPLKKIVAFSSLYNETRSQMTLNIECQSQDIDLKQTLEESNIMNDENEIMINQLNENAGSLSYEESFQNIIENFLVLRGFDININRSSDVNNLDLGLHPPEESKDAIMKMFNELISPAAQDVPRDLEVQPTIEE